MKTRRIHIEKIIVLVICCSLIMQMVWNLTKPRVYAAEGDSNTGETELLNVGTGTIEINGTEVILDSESSLQKDFEITSSENGGYKITCAQPLTVDDAEREASNISKLTVNCMGNVNINTDLSAELFMDNEYSSVTIGSGYTFNCSSLSGTTGFWLGSVIINGTLKMSSYVSSDYGDYYIENNGTISADTIDISEIPYRQGYWDEEPHPRFSDGSSSKYYATDSFIKGDDDLKGIVQAGSKDTIIKSSGGSFKLMLELDGGGTITRTIEGTNINSSAGELLFAPADINIETGDLPGFTDDFPLYEGQFYNFMEGVYTNPEVYADDVQLWYAPAGSTAFSTTRPEEAGDYQVYALLPKAGDRVESKSDTYDFSIQNLPMDELYPSGNPDFTISGYVNGEYVPEALVLTLNDEDVTFCCPAISDSFSNSLTITEEELAENNLLVDGHLDRGTMLIKFRSEEEAMDNATTSAMPIGSVVNGIGNFIFDSEKPEIIDVYFTYGEAEVETSIENNGEIIADSLSFTVYDENLRQVVCDGKTYSEDLEEGACYITIDGETGVKKSITLTATDWADNEFSISFILFNPAEVTATITVADVIVGNTPVPTVTTDPTDYDGDITVEYKLSEDPDSAYTTTEPTTAGKYTAKATLSMTDKYSSAECITTFFIKDIFTPSVEVADISVGQTPSPSITGVPEEYDGGFTIEYKSSKVEDFSEDVPTEEGIYTVRVTFADTDYYSGCTCYDDFTISKVDVTATVTVADIYVGGTVKPVLTVNPSDYDGEIKYQYKLSTASNYSSTVPSAAGTYEVLVILEPTAKYSGTSCTDTFTISKIELDPTLTVSNIYVGETVTPVWDGIPDDYDGTITFVYIDGNGNSYSAEPLPAGNYLVRATIPETDKYERAICEADLEVRKNDITEAKVTVENIKVGQTPAPVVTGVPDDYDGEITFAYIDGNGNSYSTEPLPAGSYLVRVTIPETDKYEKKVLETNLEVRKNDITGAKVTVENIKVGQTPAPVVAGLPDDYDKDLITYEYIDSEGNSRPADSLAAGNYLVSAIIPETDKYERAVCETDLVVSRYDITDAKVTVEDIVIGGTVKPELTGIPEDYDGSIAFEYKLSTAPDSSYSSSVPTEPGTYSVLAIIPETDVYTGTSVSDIFIISKNEVSATVSVADITYGGKVNPVVTTDPADYDGSITYEYKVSTDPDTAYSSTVPVDAGTYMVRASLSTTEQFLGTTCTDSFEIKKKEITATVSVADVVIGETIKPVVTTISDGTPVFEYKASTAPDSDYSSAVPTAAGSYTVRATIPETKNYLGTTCTDDFKITKKVVTASVKVADITVGHKPSPVVTTESDGKDKATFEYKASSAPDSAFSSAVPTAKGTYTVRATIPETDTYEKIVCSASFEIKLNPVTVMDLSVPDTYAGLAVKATFNTDSDGTVTIMYKASGASDTAYSAAAPKEVGSYVARASVSETAKYEAAECTANFRIVYLEAPATPFVMSGTTGKNGYYTSDVVLNAPAGYTISTTFGTGYSASVPYTEGLTSIYLKRNDGALTGAISIGTAPKIDKVAPSITSSSGSISNGSVVYTSGLTIGANDPHLASLTVNGQSVNLATGMTLTPGMWIKTFTITAEDEAGNVTTISITLKAQWLENKILPADVELPLPTNEVFYFGEGQWIVTKIVKGEKIVDPTVYNGNTPFYVDSAADSYYVTLVT